MKELGLNPGNWTYRFKSEGRTYKLYKRQKNRDGVWLIDVIIKGQRITRSLDTNHAETAVTRAVATVIKPAKMEQWETVKKNKLKTGFSLIGSVTTKYVELCIGECGERTVRTNLKCLNLVVRRGLDQEHMTEEAIQQLNLNVLTGKLVSSFELWMKKMAVAKGLDLESNKRTVISTLRCARSIFKELFMPQYRDAGLKLPDLTEFMKRLTAEPARYIKVPANDALIKKTLAEALKLWETDRSAYIAWVLALSTLRRGEIWYMQFDWLQQIEGKWVILVPKQVMRNGVPVPLTKNGTDRVVPVDVDKVVRPLEIWRTQRQLGVNVEEEKYVLPSPYKGNGGAGAKQRGQCVTRRVAEWMRGLGWTSNKTMHEMRALGLSWFAKEYGVRATQTIAGHAYESTTLVNHYIGHAEISHVTGDLKQLEWKEGQ